MKIKSIIYKTKILKIKQEKVTKKTVREQETINFRVKEKQGHVFDEILGTCV